VQHEMAEFVCRGEPVQAHVVAAIRSQHDHRAPAAPIELKRGYLDRSVQVIV
jgi:hypothetical protein